MTALARGWATVADWLTARKHSTYGSAVTRAVLGFVVWSQLVLNWPDRHYTWGDGSRWTAPVQNGKDWPALFGTFDQLSGVWFDAAYLLTIAFGFAMMIGLYSRASTVLTLILWMSLYVTNPFVGSGGDAILRMVLLYLCFVDTSQHFSLDARRAARQGEIRPLTPAWFSNTLHNVGLILIVHQVVMVYVGSAFWKFSGETWRDGTAVYGPLQTAAYSPWGDLLGPLTTSAPIIHAATWSALVVQLLFPVFLLYRPTRVAALLVVTAMHVGIGVLMGIMYFSLVMIAVDMILVTDATWDRLRGSLNFLRKPSGKPVTAV